MTFADGENDEDWWIRCTINARFSLESAPSSQQRRMIYIAAGKGIRLIITSRSEPLSPSEVQLHQCKSSERRASERIEIRVESVLARRVSQRPRAGQIAAANNRDALQHISLRECGGGELVVVAAGDAVSQLWISRENLSSCNAVWSDSRSAASQQSINVHASTHSLEIEFNVVWTNTIIMKPNPMHFLTHLSCN